MGGDNATSGDNQQETARPMLDPMWIVGFVDGEGCFSVSVHRSSLVRQTRGWQLQPTFQVYQHERYRDVLEELISFFGIGRIRAKGPNSSVLTYAVDSLRDLEEGILPFFEAHQLVVKAADFRLFAAIVRSMRRKEHLTPAGSSGLPAWPTRMNAQGKQRSRTLATVLAGSSETARRAPSLSETVKIQSDPHGDLGSQAEMPWPFDPAHWPGSKVTRMPKVAKFLVG